MPDETFALPDASRSGPSFSDHFHPIVVRQMRRMVRSWSFQAAVVLYLILASVAILVGIVTVGARPLSGMRQVWDGVGPASWFVAIAAFFRPSLIH